MSRGPAHPGETPPSLDEISALHLSLAHRRRRCWSCSAPWSRANAARSTALASAGCSTRSAPSAGAGLLAPRPGRGRDFEVQHSKCRERRRPASRGLVHELDDRADATRLASEVLRDSHIRRLRKIPPRARADAPLVVVVADDDVARIANEEHDVGGQRGDLAQREHEVVVGVQVGKARSDPTWERR